jgi:DNA-binding LacI/PurR family transcriptional regulator
MKASPAFSGFRRASLSDQAAGALREAVRSRVWGPILPGEHVLARQLGISRPSVRAALACLAGEGLIVISKGRRTRVVGHSAHAAAKAHPTVCLISSAPPASDHPVILEMKAELAAHGVGWEEVIDSAIGGKRPEHRLEEIVTRRHQVCWLLLSVSAPIQRWFEASGIPAMVLGSCFPGIKLPSLDTDYRAVGWHAGGCLARHGHRQIAMIMPHFPMPGDAASRDGMTAYFRQMDPEILVQEVAAGPNAASLEAKLDALFARSPSPSAILTMRPQYTLTVLLHLLQSGLKVPDDVSVISRDSHSLLEKGMPALTCYRSAFAKQAHRAVRLIQALLAGRSVPPRASLIIPTFVAGATVAPARPVGQLRSA